MDPDQTSEDRTLARTPPKRIGRYRIVRLIGSGGYGSVLLANDEELDREVAIKIPNEGMATTAIGDYLDEARMVARLDHPNIVPVYDVGKTEDVDYYIVSKYIPGQDLRQLLKQHRFDFLEAANLIATIADALHHAHKRGLVHRDIKPSNILIDPEGTPYVADFGLALPEQKLGKGPRFAGTPVYMSPEQARGEGHRVDGRSDIFSLGAVFYQLASGKRPFRAETRSDLLEQIEFHEPRPLRQHDEQIPKEIDRICQKALAKRANDRYWSAHDLAEDIRIFMRQHESSVDDPDRFKTSNRSSRKASGTRPGLLETATDHGQSSARDLSEPETAPFPQRDTDTDSQSVNVIPKGLRPFDAQDADFFLELLPGPKDRDGLPNSLRFWKKRIEATDVDESFSVGMIYGPSGCGKSSFVNAGLIPRLSKSITPVVVESSAEFTEQRILNRLHKSFPQLDSELGLSDAVASIRLGQGVPPGCKVVLILDQFERWLHSHEPGEGRELINALRQCDGERVQAILMVRSDFWMSVTRLLNDLEIDLVQGKNFAAVDLFPPRHAKKVLIAFGRAFGALPSGEELEPDNLGFVDKTVQNLAEDGKLICVRLALYAEMMKNKSWTLDSFNKIGGTEGIGVSFLDESFGPNANPKIRLHQIAARRVLKSLLPDSSTTINIQMKSYDQLFHDSGYSDRKQFEELIRVLDNEMRLIARTDPSGIDLDSENMESVASLDPAKKYFRLSHDYLVTALRKWLNRKQRETRRGRAELLLAERAAFWSAKPESRYLPSIPEHFRIRLLTPKAQWNENEKAVMKSAAKSHGRFLAISLAVMAALALAGVGLSNSIQERNADQLVDNVLLADTSQVRDAVAKLESYRSASTKLTAAFNNNPTKSREKLHAAMALASDSPECRSYLLDQIPVISADRLQPVCDSLNGSPGKSNIELTDRLVDMLNDNSAAAQSRLQVACAMAQLDAKHEVWEDSNLRKFVAEQLTQLYPSDLSPLRNALSPVASKITPYLRDIFLDEEREQQQRLFATESLVDYASSSPKTLYALLVDCDQRQFPLVFRALESESDVVIEMARQTIAREIPALGTDAEIRSRLARNQANAAVTLYQLGQFADVWPLVEKIGTDPTVRNLVIHGIWNRGSSPKPLLEKLCSKTSDSMLQFAMLAIGEFPIASFNESESNRLVSRVTDLLKDAKTAEIAASAQWLLRKIGREQIGEALVQTETKLRKDQRQTEIKQMQEIRAGKDRDEFANRQVAEILNQKRNFYFTGEGQMMIRLEAGSFIMGGVNDAQSQFDYAYVHKRNISRVFAIGAFEVTVKQWNAFLDDPSSNVISPEKFSSDKQSHPDRPVINVSWIEAAHYCNWLSQREGIPESQWCYVPNQKGGYRIGMKTKPKFWELSGYRLPTQAEWEYACRAGTHTDRTHGDSEHLLDKYAWYQKNTATPRDVGLLKPNQWGLFDMHGNAMEWCIDLHEPFARLKDGAQDFPRCDGAVTSKSRELRGGAYYDLPIYIRSSNRYSQPPEGHLASTGVRICRTLKNLDPSTANPEQD
jgi:serine/threonine protein kinase/formylglycine-generating enzyme required for sulfatase activity